MYKKIALAFFYCLIFHLHVTAQSTSVKIIPRFKTVSVEDGLSQSSVYSIYQDSKGYMWFGTADGINRYDGQFIKVFKAPVTANTPANSNYIRGKIVEDKKGNIWYSTETGLFVIDRFTEQVTKKYTFNAVFGFNAEYPLQFIINDTIWFVHKKAGIGCYSIQYQSVKLFPFPAGTNFFVAERYPIISANPFIWYNITAKKGIHQFNCNTKKYEFILKDSANIIHYSNDQSTSFFYNGTIVTAYSAALKKTKQIYKGSALQGAPIFRNFIQDNYQRVWMNTLDRGIYMYDLTTDKLYQYEHETSKQNSLSINFTNCLYIDRADNLWVGTDGGGACKIDLKPSRFNLFPQNEGDFPELKDYFIKCFYEDEQQRIWYGTHNNGLCIYNPTQQKLKNISSINGKPLLAVGDIFKDATNQIWVGHNKGIAIYNEQNNRFTEVPVKLWMPLVNGIIFVYRFLQRKDGDIVAATSQQLALISKKNQSIYSASVVLTGKDTIPSMVTDVKELNNGDLLLTCPSFGVLLVDSNLNYINIKKRFLVGIDLRCVFINKKQPNHVWVGSGAGLFDLNILDGTHVLYNTKNGIANEYIYGIIEDEKNNLWLSTNGGISYFNTTTKTFKNYTANDGLQSNEFNTGSYYKGASGNIYFGGIKGFNWFNPKQIDAIKTKPQVDITSIKINESFFIRDTNWYNHKSISLPYYKNDFTFTLAALDFTKPEANIISYQLTNWDNKPIITTNKEINYNNLPPGKYIFKIKCRNSNDEWSNEENLTIIIHPPFWKTWWFYTIIGIGLLIAVISITRFYTNQKLKAQIAELKRQKELYEERQRISREMHDDIGAGLTQITLMSESAKRKNTSANELESIAETSRKLVNNMSEIVWSLNPENRSVNQLMAYLREQLHKLLEHSEIEYTIQLPETNEDLLLQNNQSRNLLLIAKEIIHNAVKYSQANNIHIICIYDNNTLIFEIKDDGIGFDTSAKSTGNGLKNIQARIAEMNGTVTFESSNSNGTRFYYKIPL